uniref:Uncharacterized protein n=1 Tax=Anopheles maculatus TaxID=74869 RepID=A0A182S907_9DIPT
MIGIQARDAVKPVINQCTTKERRPLGDIDVNRSHHKIITTEDGQITGKGHIASGFQVFSDGETSSKKKDCLKISTKLASTLNGAKTKTVSGKMPFQFIDEMRNGERSVTKTASIAMKKVNAAKLADTDLLGTQIALMSIEKKANTTQHQILGTDPQAAQGIQKDASNGMTNSMAIDLTEQYGEVICATSKSVSQMQELAINSNGTGAIRKVVPETMDNNVCKLPSFQLNVKANEWNATTGDASNGTGVNNDNYSGSTPSNSEVRQLPLFWNICLENEAQASKQRGNTAGTYENHDLPYTAQSSGRKIVGRQLTPLERRQQPLNRDIMRELDDRTQEIERYERYKESRRKKAIEAMRVEQERIKWSAQSEASQHQQLRPNVLTNTKNKCQSAAIVAKTNHPSTRTVAGMHGFQRTNSNISVHSFNQVPSPPLAGKKPSPTGSNICIMKYPTPPNVPIRYEPGELWKLNYSAMHTNKRYEVQQDIFSDMTHFNSD